LVRALTIRVGLRYIAVALACPPPREGLPKRTPSARNRPRHEKRKQGKSQFGKNEGNIRGPQKRTKKTPDTMPTIAINETPRREHAGRTQGSNKSQRGNGGRNRHNPTEPTKDCQQHERAAIPRRPHREDQAPRSKESKEN